MAHFCINCPTCRSGCSLCGRCACPRAVQPTFYELPHYPVETPVINVDLLFLGTDPDPSEPDAD